MPQMAVCEHEGRKVVVMECFKLRAGERQISKMKGSAREINEKFNNLRWPQNQELITGIARDLARIVKAGYGIGMGVYRDEKRLEAMNFIRIENGETYFFMDFDMLKKTLSRETAKKSIRRYIRHMKNPEARSRMRKLFSAELKR